MTKWQTIDRPGYLGKHREEKHAEWNQKYGEGNWSLWWRWGDNWTDFIGACWIYEMAYYHFLLLNRNVLDQLVEGASNVYDDNPSNVNSGFDYSKQETNRTHIQDIAIRNALLKLGVWFRGDKLIQIRDKQGEHSLSMTLSPGQVTFHRPDLVVHPAANGWWRWGSVEEWYQSNKHLRVKVSEVQPPQEPPAEPSPPATPEHPSDETLPVESPKPT